MNDRKLNLIIGWVCFLISFIVYYLTAEPTVGFWDTGEYITTSAKLQVGHPPGAPLYQMLGAIFSIFAFDKENIGFIMNLMSGFASALAISFMYWSIILILKKITDTSEASINKQILTSGSALVGSLGFAFTDTFWFSAVETEVYAMATLIMAVIFYLGLRWEADMHNSRGNKWLLLICFVIGLSFGVHFMGLLVIPAIVMIYYFKNQKTILNSTKLNPIIGFFIANIIGLAILMGVFKLLLPSTLKFFSAIELLFVNNFGLPFNSGTLVAFVVIVYVFYFLIKHTRKKGMVRANTITLCFLFIFIGFSSWLILPIRANADVVVNENDPSNARELLAYYNLEQYPKTYLFYGPLFSDQYSGLDKYKPYKDDNPKYEKDLINNKYVIVNDYKIEIQEINFDDYVKIGDPNPDFTYSISNNFTYKNWDANILFTGQKGGDLFWVDSWQLSGLQKTTNILSSSYANSWIAPLSYENGNYVYDETIGNLNSAIHPGAMIETGSRAISSDRNIYDGSFIRLKNINIGYNFDLKNGKNMRVYLAGQNLIVWTDYPGYDPEVRTYTKNPQKRGVDFGTYPGTRSLLVGLKLNY